MWSGINSSDRSKVALTKSRWEHPLPIKFCENLKFGSKKYGSRSLGLAPGNFTSIQQTIPNELEELVLGPIHTSKNLRIFDKPPFDITAPHKIAQMWARRLYLSRSILLKVKSCQLNRKWGPIPFVASLWSINCTKFHVLLILQQVWNLWSRVSSAPAWQHG